MTTSTPPPPLILVVEDDPGDFGLVRVQMRLAGFSMVGKTCPELWARTLAQGIDMTRRESPDVVLLDLSLPDSRGLATVRAMRAAAPDLAIIVFTGLDHDALAGEALEAGAQDYLVKGLFHHDALARAVRNAMVRIKLERKIALTERILTAGIEAIDEAFVLFDSDDRLVFCNEKYRSLYAASADVLVPGTGFEDIMRESVRRGQFPDAIGHEAEWLTTRLEAHRQGSSQLIQKQVNGGWLRIVERKTADNQIVGFHVDITQLQLAREAAEATSAAKTMFLASMSHELRTPMNGVLGMLELVSETVLTETQRDYVELARTSARNLFILLNDILDFSKIEAGKLELERVKFEPRQVLCEIHRVLSMQALEKGLALDLEIDKQLPRFLIGDPARLRQVMINLLGNAIKFTADGRIAMQATVQESGADGTIVAFSVSDTGIGIAQENQQAIFDAFTQADASTTRQFGGTGLGLAICSRLIALMEGQMQVESEPGRGSIFSFVVRFGYAEGDNSALPESEPLPVGRPAPGPLPAGASLNILLAEDNPTNQKFAMAVLANAGHAVTLAQDGEEAVARARDGRFDVILMDVQMPRLDGFAATRAIRACGIATPVVALTAHAMPGFRDECLAAGMNDYLSKPVRGRELRAKLAQLCARPATIPVAAAAIVEASVAIPAADDDAPVLDIALALDMMDGDLSTLQMMLPIVLDQMAADRREIADAIRDNETARVRKTSHRLKGSLGQVGAVQARKTSALLEAAATGGDCGAFAALQKQLEGELDALAPAIADYLKDHPVQDD